MVKKLMSAVCLLLMTMSVSLAEDFTDNGNSTVFDNTTGLMWMQATVDTNEDDIIDDTDKMNWEEALEWCENLTLAGFTDWRLPTIKELISIVDYALHDPSIDSTYFLDTVSDVYWSSTSNENVPSQARQVNFDDGNDSFEEKSNENYVRAVRGGPLEDRD